MKKKIYLYLLLSYSALLFISCSTPPEKYFGTAVLNTNLLFGFAGDGFSRQLESPSAMLSGDNGETVTMKRSEVVSSKIKQTEEDLDKVESLRETDETKDMISASIALYKYVLPVYKTEYVQLAELYDKGASKEQIQQMTESIHNKYFPGYKDLTDKLVSTGKIYAEKNKINVKWDVKTSP